MLKYLHTNESLDAIAKSMQLTREDNVLAILGSGDQAFALLEYAGSVVAMDDIQEQAAYAQGQKELISQGSFEQFLARRVINAPDAYKSMQEYFKSPGRLDSIRKRLNHLEIREGDIFSDSPGNQFSKIYLSNALAYIPLKDNEQKMELLIEKLKPSGLLYITEVWDITIRPDSPFHNIEHPFHEIMKIDAELTHIARAHQPKRWTPVVYRRRA